jgi:hypothetical protein
MCILFIVVGCGRLLELRLLSYKIFSGNARLYDKYNAPYGGATGLYFEVNRIKG